MTRNNVPVGIESMSIGSKFGFWTVVEYAGRDKHKKDRWICACRCGNELNVSGSDMRRGKTESCGCYALELKIALHTTHGCTKGRIRSREYNAWCDMKKRCTNPNSTGWENYGGRGIKVCKRWEKFENFLSDMGKCPEGLSLERKNCNGHYEPSNCKWATWKEQQNNTRRNTFVKFKGKTKTVSQWSDALGMDYGAVLYRARVGHPLDKPKRKSPSDCK